MTSETCRPRVVQLEVTTMKLEWRHWLLLTRLAKGLACTGYLDDLRDLEREGYVFEEGQRWYATSAGHRALRAQLKTKPSWLH